MGDMYVWMIHYVCIQRDKQNILGIKEVQGQSDTTVKWLCATTKQMPITKDNQPFNLCMCYANYLIVDLNPFIWWYNMYVCTYMLFQKHDRLQPLAIFCTEI